MALYPPGNQSLVALGKQWAQAASLLKDFQSVKWGGRKGKRATHLLALGFFSSLRHSFNHLPPSQNFPALSPQGSTLGRELTGGVGINPGQVIGVECQGWA